MTSLTTDERWMLDTMLKVMKTPLMYISIETWMAWSGWSKKKCKNIRLSLQRKGFLFVSGKGANNKNFYGISQDKLSESVVRHDESVTTIQECQNDTAVTGVVEGRCQNDTTGGVKTTPPTPKVGVKMTPHNIDPNNIDKYNSDTELAFKKENKFESPEERIAVFTDKVEEMKRTNKLGDGIGHRATADLVADIIYHAANRRKDLTETQAVNAALELMQKGIWTRPKGLREELEAQALARERESHKRKQLELMTGMPESIRHQSNQGFSWLTY